MVAVGRGRLSQVALIDALDDPTKVKSVAARNVGASAPVLAQAVGGREALDGANLWRDDLLRCGPSLTTAAARGSAATRVRR